MKKGYTHIGILLDESGSMGPTRKDVIGGFNTLIADQKKEPGKLTVSVAKFNSTGTYSTIHNMVDIDLIKDLSEEDYSPGGGTALLDSAAKFINEVGKSLSLLPEDERPEKVLITMITDGEENDSKEITRRVLADIIKEQESKYNWQFAYVGANQDAFAEAHSFGVTSNAVTYTSNSLGTRKLFKGMSDSVAYYRSASADTVYSLSQDQIDNAKVDDNS